MSGVLLWSFFVVNDIDIHQLNLGPIKIFNLLVENLFKKNVFLHFLSNKNIKDFFFFGKCYYL
jgi:hypothetical protein